MEEDFLKEVDTLFDKNKELIDKLLEEKRLLESMFLDNRIPEKLKKSVLKPYNALTEVIDKRVDIYKTLRQVKEVSDMVGLLYNQTKKNYMGSVMKNLQGLSEKRGIKIVCFTIDDVNLEEGLVEGEVVEPSSITKRTVSIPKYILNIGCYLNPKNVNIIRQLQMINGSEVVNPVNIFNQAVVFDILSSLSGISKYILPVSTLSPSTISEYLADTNTLFLLPERGGHNNAAIRIQKKVKDRSNVYRIGISGSWQYCDEENLYLYIRKVIANKKYIVLKGRNTILWNGAPLEARVYVQKGFTGKWDVTQMIAKNEMFFSGSIYEDTVDDLDRVLSNIIADKIEDIQRKLENLALNICSYLEFYFAGLGSSTVDFIIDEEGIPFLIGFSGWDQKDYLFKINGKDTWDKYITNSMDYLLYLEHNNMQDGSLK